MTKFRTSVLLALALLVASCSKDNNTVTPPASSGASDYWMPVTAGSQLALEGSAVLSRPGFPADSTLQSETMIMTGATKAMLDGKTARVVMNVSTSEGNAPDSTESYMVLSASAITMYDSSLAAATAATMLQTPLTVGNTWLYQPSDTVHYTLVSTTASTTTPAGTFSNCLLIRHSTSDPSTGGTLTQEFYVAKGIGPVRLSLVGTYSVLGMTVTYKVDMRLKSKNF